MEMRGKQSIGCSSGHCSVRKYAGSEVTMHRFPRDPESAKEWLKRSGNPKLNRRRVENLWKSAYLCQHHFASSQYLSFVPRRLIPGALPTILISNDTNSNLPSSSVEISSSCSNSAIPEPVTSQQSILSTANANQQLHSIVCSSSTDKPEIQLFVSSRTKEVCKQSVASSENAQRWSKEESISRILSRIPTQNFQVDPEETASMSPRSTDEWNHTTEVSNHEFPPENEEIDSTVPQPTTTKNIRKHIADPCHMVEELPEVYTFVTLPHLEQSHLNVQWVYKILSGEEGHERIIYESPSKDDKDGFLLIKDPRWDGINLDNLHLLAIAYRPGILSLRDLRQHHLSLLKNIYVMGKEVIVEKYDIVGSQLRIFIQYQPSFYHLHVHFTTMNDGICESHFGKAHPLYSVINIIQACPAYYEISPLTFCLKESDDLFEKFEAHGLVKRIQQSN